MEEIEEKTTRVNRVYALLEKYHVSINPTELALFQTLQPTLRQLSEVTDIADESKEEKVQKYSLDLEKNIQDLIADVNAIRNRAQDPIILDPSATPADALKVVESLIAQADAKAQLATNYTNYQTMFKLNATKHTELEETRADLALKKTYWVAWQDWQAIKE